MDLVINSKNYMIFELIKNVTKDNRPFIRVVLMDKEGNQTPGIMFDSDKLNFEPEKGDVVSVNGVIQNYNGQMQIKINQMIKLSGEDYYEFLPKSPFDEETMFRELRNILKDKIKSEHYIQLLKKFFGDTELIKKFRKIPAGKTVHHAYINGLLEHTLSVVKLVDKIKENYTEKVDEELLILGALFHDIGKIFELDMIKGFDYTDSGKLMGHLVLGVNLIEKYIEGIDDFPESKKLVLQHMILSHHGLIEFGAVKKPKTIEALILYHADDLDSKINTFESIFNKEEIDENGWSSFDRLLERQIYKHF